METIKKGSKGEAVKKLQQILGLTVDGIFGVNTETGVRQFQKENGLTIDGIVGPKTWEKLGVVDDKCIGNGVIYKPLNVHVTKSTNRKPQYIAIHYTAGANSKPGKAESVYNTFISRNASTDFAVDDQYIVQFNPDISNYYTWSVGDSKNKYSNGGSLYGKATNKNTISIEMCSNLKSGTSASAANHSGWTFTNETLDNTVKLVKMLMSKYNIPIERVVRHYDISGKLCPGVLGWNNETIYDTTGKQTKEKNNDSTWLEFKKKLMS